MIEQAVKQERKSLDPVATKMRILDAAIDLFNQHGFHSVSLSQIGEAANMPKSLVAYHFGTKEELWSAVMGHLMKPGVDSMDRFLAGDISLAQLLMKRLELFADSPVRSRLIAWISLTELPLPEPLLERKKMLRERVHTIDPKLVERCLLAMSFMDGWYLNRRSYEMLVGKDAVENITDKRLQEEVEKLIFSGEDHS